MIHILGAAFIIIGCGSVGFIMAANFLREISTMRNLISIMEYWKNSISYHHTTLPELCRLTRAWESSILGDFFEKLGDQFNNLGEADASQCTENALSLCPDLPQSIRSLLQELGRGLGQFDLNGQLQEISAVIEEAHNMLATLLSNRDLRLRSYRIFGICAGIAIAILVI